MFLTFCDHRSCFFAFCFSFEHPGSGGVNGRCCFSRLGNNVRRLFVNEGPFKQAKKWQMSMIGLLSKNKLGTKQFSGTLLVFTGAASVLFALQIYLNSEFGLALVDTTRSKWNKQVWPCGCNQKHIFRTSLVTFHRHHPDNQVASEGCWGSIP